MANEPERPIEKLLRAAANKRRDEAGAPFELHPANRRLLQGEVARTFGRPQPQRCSFAEVLARLWPQFAGAVGLVAILGITLWLTLPGLERQKAQPSLAQNRLASEAGQAKKLVSPLPTPPAAAFPLPTAPARTQPAELAYADTAAPAHATRVRQPAAKYEAATAPTAAGTGSQAQDKLALAAARQLAARKEPAAVTLTAPSGTPTQAPVRSIGGAFGTHYGLASRPASSASLSAAPTQRPVPANTPSAPSVMATAETPKLASRDSSQTSFYFRSLAPDESANRSSQPSVAADSLLKSVPETMKQAKGVTLAQHFVQVVPGAKSKDSLGEGAAATHPVLASFEVEQAGRELRIVDGDGSVYRGSLQLATTARRRSAAKLEAPASAARPVGAVVEEKVSPTFDLDQLVPQVYSFHVAGTNRSLNKKVVFIGNLLTATNLNLSLSIRTNQVVAGRLGGLQAGSAHSNFLPLLKSHIFGKVVIGDGKAVEINALPANP